MPRKHKHAKTFNGLLSMLAGLTSNALVSGRTAERVYMTDTGPWDADMVDHVLCEIERFMREGDLSDENLGLLEWSRAGVLWGLRRFEDAANSTEAAIRRYEQQPESERALSTMRKSLHLMRQHKGPLHMVD